MRDETFSYAWRGSFTNTEINRLHAEAFDTRVFDDEEWDRVSQVQTYSLGWVVARGGDRLVGFANVLWGGLVHAYIEDVMVATEYRGRRIGVRLIEGARDGAREAGCELLHVGFDEQLRPFYIDACGFQETGGGLMEL